MPSFPPVDEQMQILMRGVDFGDAQTYKNMEAELRQRLEDSRDSGKPLKVYCGYDPSSPDLHLGHTITMRKLRQFQDLGHDVTFLIGTFTGIIGDPSDKDSARKQQTLEDAMSKAETYAQQAWRMLTRRRRVRYNHEWLAGLTFADIIRLASSFTVQQFLAARTSAFATTQATPSGCTSFPRSCRATTPSPRKPMSRSAGQISCSTSWRRKLMESFGMRPQVVLTSPILVGTDGERA